MHLSLIRSRVGNQGAIIGGKRWYFSTTGEAIFYFLRLGCSPLCSLRNFKKNIISIGRYWYALDHVQSVKFEDAQLL
jgi:hypothetical protein